MRKIIISCILICSSTFVDAQNNLVFNQVLNFNIGLGETVTVPDGKVWKLESGISQGEVLISSINQEYGNNLDSSNMDDYSLQTYNMPLWLGQGTSLTYNGSSGDNFLSILEFNVVPISSTGSGTVDSGISNGALPGDDYTPGDSFSDTDGNTYDTVEINGQTWTTTNLNVSTYRDGTPIPYISDYDEWNSATTGAYTYAAQDSEAGYGKLYNLYAVLGDHDGDPSTSNKILAPEGYHIPTSNEWSTLIEFYMDDGIEFNFDEIFENYSSIPFQHSVASIYLKSQTSWNINGNNESGLNIKSYPRVNDYDDFYGIDNNNSIKTAFATQTWCQFSLGSVIGVYGIGISDTGLEIFPLSDYQGGNYPEDNRGHYVRLIKDY